MRIGTLIIGDEILSGKRQDKHFTHVIETLAARGLELAWARYLGDVPAQIVQTLKETYATGDVVFSFGGIGATPDDHTRQCAAEAAGVPFVRHPGAVAEIEAQFGELAYPNRILMADLPEGCDLIPNPVNRIPGFSLRHHHFMPGFPQMSWPMMEWVLDNVYRGQCGKSALIEQIIVVPEVKESDLLGVMNTLVSRFPEVRFSSLPHLGPQDRHIEFGIKGVPEQVEAAMAYLKGEIAGAGFSWRDKIRP
jgi:molybdopterin-biosynthesis enzyme MoeA-like protein